VGLPARDSVSRRLAVGMDRLEQEVEATLAAVDELGGRCLAIRGEYGQGKTFALNVLEQMAVNRGFVTARTEIDAVENRLDRPHQVYRGLMGQLRVPDAPDDPLEHLGQRLVERIDRDVPRSDWFSRYQWLGRELGCRPIAWLFSDPDVLQKPSLAGLLRGDPNVKVATARRDHCAPGMSHWPAFNASTQGDFASYLLSGLGRIVRMLGYRGFFLIFDEMEKWQDVHWREQVKAGNLIGGLIWAATAEDGRRSGEHEPHALIHSGRMGGSPFTTDQRCHIGLAIAMTPRDAATDPIADWLHYGPMEVVDLPSLTPQRLSQYCQKLAPIYAAAHRLQNPTPEQVRDITEDAVKRWLDEGEMSMRGGVSCAMAALNDWRLLRESGM